MWPSSVPTSCAGGRSTAWPVKIPVNTPSAPSTGTSIDAAPKAAKKRRLRKPAVSYPRSVEELLLLVWIRFAVLVPLLAAVFATIMAHIFLHGSELLLLIGSQHTVDLAVRGFV